MKQYYGLLSGPAVEVDLETISRSPLSVYGSSDSWGRAHLVRVFVTFAPPGVHGVSAQTLGAQPADADRAASVWSSGSKPSGGQPVEGVVLVVRQRAGDAVRGLHPGKQSPWLQRSFTASPLPVAQFDPDLLLCSLAGLHRTQTVRRQAQGLHIEGSFQSETE